MFGIANQLLSVIALAAITSWVINSGRRKYAPLTILPMLFVITTTMTAGYQLITGPFNTMFTNGWRGDDPTLRNWGFVIKGGLNIALTLFMMTAVAIILFQAVTRWLNQSRRTRAIAPGREKE
jgi:carbon starvation protein